MLVLIFLKQSGDYLEAALQNVLGQLLCREFFEFTNTNHAELNHKNTITAGIS